MQVVLMQLDLVQVLALRQLEQLLPVRIDLVIVQIDCPYFGPSLRSIGEEVVRRKKRVAVDPELLQVWPLEDGQLVQVLAPPQRPAAKLYDVAAIVGVAVSRRFEAGNAVGALGAVFELLEVVFEGHELHQLRELLEALGQWGFVLFVDGGGVVVGVVVIVVDVGGVVVGIAGAEEAASYVQNPQLQQLLADAFGKGFHTILHCQDFQVFQVADGLEGCG
mmetsp:Transcript_93024/g.194403  ORF Transcript_93024/g.194403 Transcript_93024/m.194403 type:complete len:220 (+) Transcript_93024:311-970(+)